MAGYGDDNKDYSDSQRDYNKGTMYYDGGDILDVVGRSFKKVNTTTSKMFFCPSCGAMMLERNGIWVCNSCGYSTNEPSKNNHHQNINSKRKTYLELIIKRTNLKINHQLEISGYLRLKNDYVLINADIDIYVAGRYVKSTVTDEDGHFESKFTINTIGKQEVKIVFEGDSEYEKSTARSYINIVGQRVNVTSTSRVDDDVITKLEKLGALYEQGLLTDEEFKEMKRRLIG